MLRLDAKQGLLITTSTFSRVAQQAAQASDAAPIRLIDGEALLGLMIDGASASMGVMMESSL